MPRFRTVCITGTHMYTGTHIAYIHTHTNTSCETTHSQPSALPSLPEPGEGCFYHHAHLPDEGIRAKHRSDLQCPTASKLCPGSSLALRPQPASPQALSCALGVAITQLGDAVFSASSQNHHTRGWCIPAHSKGPDQ